ncbi:MAG: ATP-dependent DNA helicase [Patescibacteria group bacterium]|jgi:DNA helicase-2/ATP-dependent DNA helicase PcrA
MSDLLEDLNDAQRAAVTHENGPLLIVAGAGTGKTTVLARRYAWLFGEKGLKSENILALTFTEKSAEEMEDRVLQLLPNGAYDFWISTFHGFCQRILETYALEIGLPNRFRIINGTDAWLLMKRRLDALPLNHYRPLGNPVKFLGGLLQHISRAKDEGVSVERYLDFARDASLDGDTEFVDGERKRLQELADCYAAYRHILREEGAMDFGDLIVETLRLLRERPAVLKELQTQFKTVMVDEFQDTNWAQYELVKLLAGDERNLTVVGDDDQAIYKFRGASLANILQFRDDFPDAKTIALTQNYRSRQEILDTAYGFIKKNDPHRLEVKLADTGLSKALSAARGVGGAVTVRWYRSLDEEAEAIAKEIRAIHAREPEGSWNDFAILVRSNDGAIPFVQSLDRNGIPFRFFAMRGLYAKPLIVDLLSLLRLCNGYHESTIVWRVMSMDLFGITAHDAAEFIQYANRKGVPLWFAIMQAAVVPGISEDGARRAAKLVSLVSKLAETAKRESPLKVFQHTLNESGLLAAIMKYPEGEKIEAIGLLNAFADRIKRYELMTHGANLKGFLEELHLEIESGEEGALAADPDAGPELVKIMTVHASKGLEFRHVFIVSMVDQRFPTRPRSDAIPLPEGLVNERLPEGDAHLEEERRLLYVAMTRAKETLMLTGASNYGGARQKKPSVFLEEAGLEAIVSSLEGGDALALTVQDVVSPREEAEREVFQLKRRFSFTQLAAFRNCPLQYKYAHVYRIPILGSFHKSFGQSIHLAFHDILKMHVDRGAHQQSSLFDAAPSAPMPGFRVTLDEALQIFEDRWIDEWYPNRAEHDKYKKEGRDGVRRMWTIWNANIPAIKALEQSFDWRLGEHSIKGSVDRIDELPGGGVAIYDYKTGTPKTGEDLDSGAKEQLRIYQLAMEERGYDVRKLAFIYVRSGEEAEVDLLKEKKREAFREEIQERMTAVLASRFPAKPSKMICQFCDFKNICEYRA